MSKVRHHVPKKHEKARDRFAEFLILVAAEATMRVLPVILAGTLIAKVPVLNAVFEHHPTEVTTTEVVS